MFTGCGKGEKKDTNEGTGTKTEENAKDSDSSAVKPKEHYNATLMYFIAKDAPDQSLINEAINKLAEEQLNMTIDFLPVTFGTYYQQIQLMLSGGEPLDVFPMFANSAGTYIESQYIIDLSELVKDQGKELLEVVGEDDVNCSKVGDFLYAITTMRERANPVGLIVRTDILDETGVKAEDVKTMDDITNLYAKVKELHPDMTCYNGVSTNAIPQILTIQDPIGDNFGCLEDMGQTTTVTNWYESDDFKNYVMKMREWYTKGYTSQDMPTSSDSGEALMRAGNLFSFSTYYKPNTKQEKDSMTGFDTTLIPITQPFLSTYTTAGIGYGIASSSEDPERVMELLNWLYTNPEVNDLLNWGIEGKHWVVQDDGTINYPEGITGDNVGYHQDFGFALPNQFLAHVWDGNPTNIFDSYKEIRENAVMSKAYGFSYDTTPVINEVAAVTAVTEQYLAPICTGSVDPDVSLKEFNKALYDAGLQKIIDEKQKQLDAWFNK